jgi:protein involved in polysaccharide export with SLBB domain
MRVTRPLLSIFALAVAVAGCARQPAMQMAAAPSPYGIDNMVYGSAAPAYAAPAQSSRGLIAPTYPVATPRYGLATAPAYATAAAPASRGIFAPTYVAATPRYGVATAPAYATVAAPSYRAAAAPAPIYGTAATTYAAVAAPGYGARSYGMVAAPVADPPPAQGYTLDSGDRLRIVVFGQDGLTNSYVVDASGDIAMPLIGSVAARGLTTDELSGRVADLLRHGYVREPHVAVEVEAYRPFFILGEVTQPGQYPYVANMTVETAVAIAGGFGPRGYKKSVIISRSYGNQVYRFETPITAQIRPGDTIQVQERWF